MADDRYRDNMPGARSGPRRSNSIFSDDDVGDRGSGGRGLFERARDNVSNWLGGDEDRASPPSQERSRYGQGQSGFGGEHYRSNSSGGGVRYHAGSGGGYPGREQSNTSHFDENYRRWREQQIARLDEEYEEYCRERQQRFESDFHSWRETRQARGGEASERGEPRDSFGGESMSDTAGLGASRSALLGDDGGDESDAGAITTGGGEASAMEASTGSSPDLGEDRGRS